MSLTGETKHPANILPGNHKGEPLPSKGLAIARLEIYVWKGRENNVCIKNSFYRNAENGNEWCASFWGTPLLCDNVPRHSPVTIFAHIIYCNLTHHDSHQTRSSLYHDGGCPVHSSSYILTQMSHVHVDCCCAKDAARGAASNALWHAVCDGMFFVLTYTYTYVYIYIYIYMRICINIYIHIYIYLYICIYIFVYICIYAYIYKHVYTFICTHIHTHTHILIHMYTHICIYIQKCIWMRLCVRKWMYMCMCKCVYMFACCTQYMYGCMNTYVCMHFYVCMCICICRGYSVHICLYVCMHVFEYICTYIQLCI